MLRIITGEYKSRRLASPPDEEVTRPYPERVREAVFNLLRGWFEDARVLDLFAGVGSMGLEAVSRGAAEVMLVEKDQRIFRLLEQNIAALGCGDRAKAVFGDALSPVVLARSPRPVEVVFVDPPFRMMLEQEQRRRVFEQIARCRDIMAESSFLVLRSPVSADEADLSVPGLAGPEAHRYGKGMWVLLYAPEEADSAPESAG